MFTTNGHVVHRCDVPSGDSGPAVRSLSYNAVSITVKRKCSPYLITERRVPELIPVFGSQRAGDVSHKPGGRLPSLSVRPAGTPATLNPPPK